MSAYNGKEKFLFISYAHKDSGVVLPLVDGLAARGVRLWYDEGIEVGTEWAEFIEERILGCEVLLLFLSRASVESINCREEFALARESGKKILICYLEELSPSELGHGLRLRVPSYQCVFLTRHPNAVSLLDEICRARILEGCIEAPAPKASERVTGIAAGERGKAESPLARDERLEVLQRAESTPAPTVTPAPSIPTVAPTVTPAPSIPTVAPTVTPATVVTATAAPSPAVTVPSGASTATKKPKDDVKYSEGLEIGGLGLLKGIGSCRDEVIVVPPRVGAIERGAFKNCKRLKEIVLPERIKVIPADVFSGCTNLKKVTIPKSLTHIGARAFYNCKRLTDINIHTASDMQFIGDRAFMNCKDLYLSWIPGDLIELGERAFYNCLLGQGLFSKRTRKIGHLALGSSKPTYACVVYYKGTFEEWERVERDGKIMSCRVQYVSCWVDDPPFGSSNFGKEREFK